MELTCEACEKDLIYDSAYKFKGVTLCLFCLVIFEEAEITGIDPREDRLDENG